MGIDMASSKGYPAQLQGMLGSGYDVRNFGVSARTMLNKGDHPYMKELAWKDAQAFDPDIVVIKLGTNDSKDYNWNAHKAEFESDYQAMIDTLWPLQPVLNKKGKPTKKMKRADRPRIYLCTPVKAFRDQWGITDSVIVNEVIPAIHRVAERNGLPVIDLHPVITDRADMTGDMIHPNEKGAAKMAKTIAEQLKNNF
jgi:lysophospholipase L1-like esterase